MCHYTIVKWVVLKGRKTQWTWQNSPTSSLSLCFSDSPCIWESRTVSRDKEAQQRSSEMASVQDRGCGRRVSRSASLLAQTAFSRWFSTELRVCRNKLSWVAVAHNLARQPNLTPSVWKPLRAELGKHRRRPYLRCRLIVKATHRNSPMSGSGRYLTEPRGLSACFSFCSRIVNHSTWSSSMREASSCWSRLLIRGNTDQVNVGIVIMLD